MTPAPSDSLPLSSGLSPDEADELSEDRSQVETEKYLLKLLKGLEVFKAGTLNLPSVLKCANVRDLLAQQFVP